MSFGGRGGRGGGGGHHGGRGHASPSVSNANEAEDAEQTAAERNLIRKCVDYHAPAVIDLEHRYYHKASCSGHVRSAHHYLQPHSAYFRMMGLPISHVADPINSMTFCTYLAHVTRAKNSTPIMCLSWTPGGRRLLTGNQDGEFTLWDGITFGFELIMSAHDSSFRSMEW
jgi:polyadenylation factor subunit 2